MNISVITITRRLLKEVKTLAQRAQKDESQKMRQTNVNQKESGLARLISDKTGLKIEALLEIN